MPKFTIKADISATIEMTVDASNADEARAAFLDKLIITAALNDPNSYFEVHDDYISEVEIKSVEED